MKRLISFILLCSLLMACFAGCFANAANVNNQESTNEAKDPENNVPKETEGENKDNSEDDPNEKENEYIDVELKEYLNQIASDVEGNSKITFFVEYEEDYYECKSSDLYKNDEWFESEFHVRITCNYANAVNEEWYKKIAEKDIGALNEAFYNYHCSDFEHVEFFNTTLFPGLSLSSTSLDEFKLDYSGIKALADLEYVTDIGIGYYYGLPHTWFEE